MPDFELETAEHEEPVETTAVHHQAASTGPEKDLEVVPLYLSLCNKEYKSVAGFRGHVSKKHNRPDLKGKMTLHVQ